MNVATTSRLCTTNIFQFLWNSAKITNNNNRTQQLEAHASGGLMRLCCAVTALAGAEELPYSNPDQNRSPD